MPMHMRKANIESLRKVAEMVNCLMEEPELLKTTKEIFFRMMSDPKNNLRCSSDIYYRLIKQRIKWITSSKFSDLKILKISDRFHYHDSQNMSSV